MTQQLPHASTRRSPAALTNIPSAIVINQLCTAIRQQEKNKRDAKREETVKSILTLLGSGMALSAMIIAPGSARAFMPLLKRSANWETWSQFDTRALRRALKRMQKAKEVRVVEKNDEQIVTLTHAGIRKVIAYSMDSLVIPKPKTWDGLWRLVLYDVPKTNKTLGDAIRKHLKSLGFLAIQKSVYLHPYPCYTEIEYLRQVYGLGNSVQFMEISRIEHDELYRRYFKIH